MSNAQTGAGFKSELGSGNDFIQLQPTGLGARLRANAHMLETAVKTRRIGPRVLRALVNDLLVQAAEAEAEAARNVEARAWMASAANAQPVVWRAAA